MRSSVPLCIPCGAVGLVIGSVLQLLPSDTRVIVTKCSGLPLLSYLPPVTLGYYLLWDDCTIVLVPTQLNVPIAFTEKQGSLQYVIFSVYTYMDVPGPGAQCVSNVLGNN